MKKFIRVINNSYIDPDDAEIKFTDDDCIDDLLVPLDVLTFVECSQCDPRITYYLSERYNGLSGFDHLFNSFEERDAYYSDLIKLLVKGGDRDD